MEKIREEEFIGDLKNLELDNMDKDDDENYSDISEFRVQKKKIKKKIMP